MTEIKKLSPEKKSQVVKGARLAHGNPRLSGFLDEVMAAKPLPKVGRARMEQLAKEVDRGS